MLPDLRVLDHEHSTETSNHSREPTMRKVCIEAITQATAVAKSNRAPRTRTTVTFSNITMKETKWITIPPQPLRTTGGAGMAHSQL
eukprot:6782575-Pyramimonas_sp.AAC.1